MTIICVQALSRLRLALPAIAILALCLAAGTPAQATCSNTTPVTGETVTCAPPVPETNPVSNPAADNVTVNVQPGASITVGNNTPAILLRDMNVITNLGTIVTGNATSAGAGIAVLSDNIITNNGTITAGNAVGGGQIYGILGFGDNNLITNNNLITVGNGSNPTFPNAVGIGIGSDSRVVNNGSIITGNRSFGIDACCNNTIINNAGALIQTGDDSYGIFALDGNTISNAGLIVVGSSTNPGQLASHGIVVDGSDNRITNTGTIIVGNQAIGIGIDDTITTGAGGQTGNVLINDVGGTIQGGNGSFGMSAGTPSSGDPAFSTLINSGTIIVGNAFAPVTPAIGMASFGPASITNSGSGLIQTGNDSYGIFAIDDSTIVNQGRIVVGDSTNFFFRGHGIVVAGRDNTVTNFGTIVAGNLAVGMGIDDTVLGGGGNIDGNTLVNAAGGTIRVGNGSYGMASGALIFPPPASATLINNGTIIAGDAIPFTSWAVGMISFGPANITNNGSITVGNGDATTSTFGILAFEDGVNIVNTRTITVGNFGTGIAAWGDNSTLVNSGTIVAGANGTGIAVQPPFGGAFGAGLTITNSGSIIVGAGGFGVRFDDFATLTNTSTGLIRASGAGAQSLFTCFPCGVAVVTNFGTIDGQITLNTAGSTLTNNGLITITDSDAVNPVGLAHQSGDAFVQGPGGVLGLRVTADGRNDMLMTATVAGTVTLNGALRALVQPGLYANTTTYLNVVTSGTNITGQFSAAQSSSVFFTATAIHNLQTVDLTLNRLPFNAVPGMTPNQIAVGAGLERAYSTTLGGNAATLYGNLLAFGSPASFDQLSGQGHTASQSAVFGAGALFTSGMLNPGPGGNGAASFIFQPTAYAAAAPAPRGHEAFAALKAAPAAEQPGRWRLWTLGFGNRQNLDGDASLGIAGQTATTAGGSFGFDRRFGEGFTAGFAVGGSASRFTVGSLFTSGDITGGHLGAYALKTWGAFYAAGSLAYGRFSTNSARTVMAAGLIDNPTADFDSDLLSGRLELGWRQAYGLFVVTPFAAVQPAWLRQHGFVERSAGILGLVVPSRTTNALPTFLGVQAETSFAVWDGAVLTPTLRASWVHEFEPNRELSAAFVAVPAAGFTVGGARPARDAARVEAGAKLALRGNVGFFANLDAELSSRSTSYGVSGGIRALW